MFMAKEAIDQIHDQLKFEHAGALFSQSITGVRNTADPHAVRNFEKDKAGHRLGIILSTVFLLILNIAGFMGYYSATPYGMWIVLAPNALLVAWLLHSSIRYSMSCRQVAYERRGIDAICGAVILANGKLRENK